MPIEGEAVRPSVIKRFECPECGSDDVFAFGGTTCENYNAHPLGDYPEAVERVYWAADEVLEALKYGRFPGAAGHLLRRFSGEGAS